MCILIAQIHLQRWFLVSVWPICFSISEVCCCVYLSNGEHSVMSARFEFKQNCDLWNFEWVAHRHLANQRISDTLHCSLVVPDGCLIGHLVSWNSFYVVSSPRERQRWLLSKTGSRSDVVSRGRLWPVLVLWSVVVLWSAEACIGQSTQTVFSPYDSKLV